MSETFAEEVARLQREIGERQMRLSYLVLGDQTKCVSMAPAPNGAPSSMPTGIVLAPTDKRHVDK